MTVTPFLKQLAAEYVKNEAGNLIDYCFVTPNKRTATFLLHYFSEVSKELDVDFIMPETETISDLISDLTDTVDAGRIELIFILYKVYSRIVTAHASKKMLEKGSNLLDFNKFQYWAEVVLNDFNDVDKYLVDAEQLFHNIEVIKEIKSNYLTAEQYAELQKYFKNVEMPPEAEKFWAHVIYKGDGTIETTSERKKNVPGFIKLWQSMFELYTEFKKDLRSLGLAYSGMAYRDCVARLKTMGAEDFRFKRYIFVGFNVLSKSEEEIFDQFKRKGIGDFYWDYASPAFEFKSNSATRFLSKLVKEFPSVYNEVGRENLPYPKIEVVSVPSTLAQTQIIADLINQQHSDILASELSDKTTFEHAQNQLMNTAIILPDEAVCLPLLRSLPDKLLRVEVNVSEKRSVKKSLLNVTMGYPLRQTPVATLFHDIIQLQLRSKLNKNGGNFLYTDVLKLITNPFIREADPEACDYLTALINDNRYFQVPSDLFADPKLASLRPVFVLADTDNWFNAIDYLNNLIDWLLESLDEQEVDSKSIDDELDDIFIDSKELIGEKLMSMQQAFLSYYKDALEQFVNLIATYMKPEEIFLETHTVFHLVDRLLGNQKVTFTGLPLKGLQIMGVLENRNLDFETIIIPSMNERIFPRRHFSKSFIPNALREAYQMSTIEHQESIYAYYFYRMISRAKNIVLLYDGRSSGTKSGQVSRYVDQLMFMAPPENIKFTAKSFDVKLERNKGSIEIAKTDEIMNQIRQYLYPNGKKFLSASSINAFINCPLQFYLQNIKEYYEDEEMKDFMDASIFGKVVHSALETIYNNQREKATGSNDKPLYVDKSVLKEMRADRVVNEAVAFAIRKEYLKKPDSTAPLIGQNDIYHHIMVEMVKTLLKKEESRTPFYFLEAEKKKKIPFKVNDDLTINLTYVIDRVDFVETEGEKILQVIDYKTGSDKTTASSMDDLFNADKHERKKALLQCLLYCNAYAQDHRFQGKMSPWIFSLRNVAKESLSPIKIEKNYVTDYHDFNDEFMERLTEVLNNLFAQDVPFRNQPSDDHCKYCRFKDLCN